MNLILLLSGLFAHAGMTALLIHPVAGVALLGWGWFCCAPRLPFRAFNGAFFFLGALLATISVWMAFPSVVGIFALVVSTLLIALVTFTSAGRGLAFTKSDLRALQQARTDLAAYILDNMDHFRSFLPAPNPAFTVIAVLRDVDSAYRPILAFALPGYKDDVPPPASFQTFLANRPNTRYFSWQVDGFLAAIGIPGETSHDMFKRLTKEAA